MIKKIFLLAFSATVVFCQEVEFNTTKTIFEIPENPGPHDSVTSKSTTRSPKFVIRVINGQQARDGQFPWTVRLTIGVEGGTGILCTGAIISSNFVLSARHCIAGTSATFIEAAVGSVDRESSSMKRVYINMAWFLTGNNPPDIAIYRLVQHLSFNNLIAPIRLPRRSQENEQFAGRPAVFSGWGGTYNGLPRFMQFGKFVMRSDCGFANTELCSKGEGNTDARGGDSGGPLVIYEDQPTLVGILVFGTRDLAGSTRVAKFLQFINDITGIPIRN